MRDKLIRWLKKHRDDTFDRLMDAMMEHDKPTEKRSFIDSLKEWGWLVIFVLKIVLEIASKIAILIYDITHR